MKITDIMGEGAPVQDDAPTGGPPHGQSGSIAERVRAEREAAPAAEGDGAAATGEGTQEDYDKVVMAATEILHGGEGTEKVLQMLSSMKDTPDKAIAEVGVMLLVQIDEKMGGAIPDNVIIEAAAEITEEVAALASAKQVFPVDQKVIQKAGHYMLMKLGEAYDIGEEELQEFMGGVDEATMREAYAQESALYDEDEDEAQPGAAPAGV